MIPASCEVIGDVNSLVIKTREVIDNVNTQVVKTREVIDNVNTDSPAVTSIEKTLSSPLGIL